MKPATPKMMLGFVVRQCAVELGRTPEPSDLVEWANNRRGFDGSYCVFGRAISLDEAAVILRNPERMVAVHPEWEERRAPIITAPEPNTGRAVVLQFPSVRRARS